MPKIFIVKGKMLLSHDHFPKEQPFMLEVTGISEKDVKEKVYSILGSKHKLKRYHIKIEEIKETEEPMSKNTLELLELKGWSA
ncbi:MAG: 50S ribosomal protein L18Ae [Fervidicoccaceae archaeon]